MRIMPAERPANVALRPPAAADAAAFIAAARASRRLHGSWVQAPDTPARFGIYLERYGDWSRDAAQVGLLAYRRGDGALVGVVNLSGIARGPFQSAYLGYYAFAPLAGTGLMALAFARALDHAFGKLRLHRVEANVQPGNRRSIALVTRAGFVLEGRSRRYLRIAGRWRDHLRFALLAEDWKARGRRERSRRR
jgi:ribosomal-protein-alanine N-acetyltransferase